MNGSILGKLQTYVARFRIGAWVAVKTRNQANSIIASRCATTSDSTQNGEYLLLKLVAPSIHTFVDVGANRGDWSAELLRFAPQARGVLYEPGTAACALLHERFQALEKISIRSVGCGAVAETLQSLEGPEASELSSFVTPDSPISGVKRPVELVCLDDDLPGSGIETVDLLKIDTEGLDFRVLRGAERLLSRCAIGLVQFEYGSSWASEGTTLLAACNLLRSYSYTVYVIRADGLYDFDPTVLGEFFRYSNFLACSPDRKATIAPLIKSASIL